MRIFIGVLLLIHGLITVAQAKTGFAPGTGTANPAWLSWWPVNLGQSWLIKQPALTKTAFGTISGILWVGAGLCLIGAASGLFGFILPTQSWRLLAGIGAAVSLILFVFYAHPLYLVGIGANLAILLVLLWAKWPSPALLGS